MSDEVMEFSALQAQLQQLENTKTQLIAAMQEQRERALTALIEQVTAHIAACGFTAEEVIARLMPPQKGRKAKPSKGKQVTGSAKVMVDRKTGKEYARGPKPAWLVARMQEEGLDPKNKEDWQKFREVNMYVKSGFVAAVMAPEPAAEVAAEQAFDLPPPPPPVVDVAA